MQETMLAGRGRTIERIPADNWRQHLETMAKSPHRSSRLDFMTPNHRAIRAWLVAEIARNGGRPVTPRQIADHFGLDEQAVNGILADMEPRLFFLVRNARREVTWAFPVTAERTAHDLRFDSGEHCHGA